MRCKGEEKRLMLPPEECGYDWYDPDLLFTEDRAETGEYITLARFFRVIMEYALQKVSMAVEMNNIESIDRFLTTFRIPRGKKTW